MVGTDDGVVYVVHEPEGSVVNAVTPLLELTVYTCSFASTCQTSSIQKSAEANIDKSRQKILPNDSSP
eukprot:5671488-Amphidinium_carterae.1